MGLNSDKTSEVFCINHPIGNAAITQGPQLRMSLRFVQFAFAVSEEANYQSSFYEVAPCKTSLYDYEAKDFALKFAVQCEGFRPKLRRARRKMFSPKSSPCEAKGFRPKLRRMRRKVFALKFAVRGERFSPETSPCEAKGFFALNFVVRSERRFRPKLRRMRRKIFSPKRSPCEAKDFRLKVRRARRKVFARNFAVRGERCFRLKRGRTKRKTFSPETSPCEAKGFALKFAVKRRTAESSPLFNTGLIHKTFTVKLSKFRR